MRGYLLREVLGRVAEMELNQRRFYIHTSIDQDAFGLKDDICDEDILIFINAEKCGKDMGEEEFDIHSLGPDKQMKTYKRIFN